jgi:hypothetical protein
MDDWHKLKENDYFFSPPPLKKIKIKFQTLSLE